MRLGSLNTSFSFSPATDQSFLLGFTPFRHQSRSYERLRRAMFWNT